MRNDHIVTRKLAVPGNQRADEIFLSAAFDIFGNIDAAAVVRGQLHIPVELLEFFLFRDYRVTLLANAASERALKSVVRI